MTNIRSFFLSGLAAVSAALALTAPALGMPTPEDVLTRARQGRADYIQVLGEVEAGAPALASNHELYPYINELDELLVIATDYDLDTVGSGPLPNAALALTRSAIKFARVGDDSVAQLTTILRWSEDDVRFEIGQAQRAYLARTDGKDAFFQWHFDLGLLLDAIKTLRAATYVTTSFEDLQATTTTKLVGILDELSNPEVMRFLRALRSVGGFETFYTELERRILATTDVAFLKLALTWTVVGNTQLQQQTSVPSNVARLPGEIAREGVAKLLQLNDTADPSLALQIIGLMTETQVVEYLQTLQQVTRDRISDSQVEFLFLTLREMSLRLERAGLVHELEVAQALLSRVSMLRASATTSYEGVFDVQVGTTPGKLTIADMGDSNFIMCLSLNYGGTPVYYSLFNVAYNFRDDSWEAHRFAVDDPRYVMPNWPDWYMKFKLVVESGRVRIDGTFSDTMRFMPIRGNRVTLLNQQWGITTARLDNLSGGYGASTSTDGARSVYLTITQVGMKLAGTLRLNGGAAKVDLVYGYFNRERSLFRMTSAELGSGRWVQIRGQVIADHLLVGDYILGGDGAYLENQSFQKVDN